MLLSVPEYKTSYKKRIQPCSKTKRISMLNFLYTDLSVNNLRILHICICHQTNIHQAYVEKLLLNIDINVSTFNQYKSTSNLNSDKIYTVPQLIATFSVHNKYMIHHTSLYMPIFMYRHFISDYNLPRIHQLGVITLKSSDIRKISNKSDAIWKSPH